MCTARREASPRGAGDARCAHFAIPLHAQRHDACAYCTHFARRKARAATENVFLVRRSALAAHACRRAAMTTPRRSRDSVDRRPQSCSQHERARLRDGARPHASRAEFSAATRSRASHRDDLRIASHAVARAATTRILRGRNDFRRSRGRRNIRKRRRTYLFLPRSCGVVIRRGQPSS